MSQTPSIEIVSVEFLPQFSYEEQVRAMASLSASISEFDGFISREYFYSRDLNRWTDVINWSDESKAKLASEKIMGLACAQEVFPMMNQDSLVMGHFAKVS